MEGETEEKERQGEKVCEKLLWEFPPQSIWAMFIRAKRGLIFFLRHQLRSTQAQSNGNLPVLF